MASYIAKFVTAFVKPFQSLEDAGQQMVTERDVYNAVGAQQDLLGRIVGQARNGLDDPTYQRYLLARIATNRSKGTIEDLIKVATLLVNDPTAKIVVDNQGVATVLVRVEVIPVTDALANVLLSFLSATVSGGVRLILETIYVVDSDQWHFGLCAFANGAMTAGNTTIVVDSTTGFPATGSLDVDTGLAVAETVTYGGTTSTSFISVSALANNHVSGTCVTLSGSPGKGMGDTGNPATGGELDSARDKAYP